MDIRVKTDGTTASSAGDAVREQIDDVNDGINYLSFSKEQNCNLFNVNDLRNRINEGYWGPSGFTEHADYSVSHPIFVTGGVEYKITHPDVVGKSNIIAHVDNYGNWISKIDATISGDVLIWTAPKSMFISVNLGHKSDIANVVVAKSSNYSTANDYYDVDTLSKKIDEENPIIADFPKNLCNMVDRYSHENQLGYWTTDGYEHVVKTENDNFIVSHPILVAEGVEYKCTHEYGDLGTNTLVAIVDKAGNPIDAIHGELSVDETAITFTPDITCLISINMGLVTSAHSNNVVLARANDFDDVCEFVSLNTLRDELLTTAKCEKSVNLTNCEDMSSGYYAGTEFVENSNYRTSGYIPVDSTKTYTKYCNPVALGTSATKIVAFDLKYKLLGSVIGEAVNNNEGFYYYDKLPANTKYIRYTHGFTADVSPTSVYFGEGNTVPTNPFPTYANYLDHNVKVRAEQIENNNDALYGKVWYAIGDSATHGDFTGITQPPLDEGIYAGQLPVYPFFIGNRTGMIVHNLAVNGAVIATIPDQPSRYQWSKTGVYDELVGSDADYITIWLGANDMWQHVPIGTIDSSDPTTFYGAWNTLLSYYSQNYPLAKLGVVVSFWCTQEYAEAVKAVAKKYGVPTLNLYDDDKLPVTVGSKRPDVSETVKNYRDAQWRVSQDNGHPSAEYHEIESYFIENWLRGL